MDEKMIREVAAHLATRLNDGLGDVAATRVELTRDEAVLALGLIEGVQEILTEKATATD